MICSAAIRPIFLAYACICAGCANPAAPDIAGRWKPVNHFAERAQEIPLHRAYVFHASPMDRTLKTMLERWSLDSATGLRYLHPSDFTLHGPVAGLRTRDLDEAVATLNRLYAENGVAVSVENGQILVRAAARTPGVEAGAEASRAAVP